MNVELISSTPNALELLKTAAGQCYQSRATKATIQHIIKAGHWSVLEHCSASFKVSCSLLVLLQLTRHRHLSFTVQSTRACKMEDTFKTGDAKVDDAITDIMHVYDKCLEEGRTYEEVAYLLPKATEYKFVVTGNFRAWMEYLPKRMCMRASVEHQKLANWIHNELMEVCPEVFQHVTVNCNACNEKGCAFK